MGRLPASALALFAFFQPACGSDADDSEGGGSEGNTGGAAASDGGAGGSVASGGGVSGTGGAANSGGTSSVGTGGGAGEANCDVGCTRQSSGGWCMAPDVAWTCMASYDHETMTASCTDLPSGAIRFCCPAEFLAECE